MTNISATQPESGSSDVPTMTEEFIVAQCKKHNGYSTPELNEKLYLHHFGFAHLNGLNAFTGCTVVYLSHNALSSLDGLAALTHLDSLYASCNALSNLDSLPALPALRTLDVSQNAITSLAGLDEAAPQLRTLLAGHNRLTQLCGLQGCTALLSVDLSHNKLEDEEKVDAGLRPLRPSLRTLLLHGNALCRHAQHYRQRWVAAFAALRFLDEYPVFDDERERAEAFVRGGALAEAATRDAQKARAAAETHAQFQYFGDLRDASREARRRDGPALAPTNYFLTHAATATTTQEDSDEDDVYLPSTAAAAVVHADPLQKQ